MDIALMGYSRSGKDTAGRYLVESHGYTRVAFADPVRESLLALDPIVSAEQDARLSDVVDLEGWERAKDHYPEVRRLLQAHGTEAVRGVLDDLAWIRIAERKIRAARPGPVVITDCRFPNEVAHLRAWGFRMVWVRRPGYGPLTKHASEVSLSARDADVVLRNYGTEADLRRFMDEILERR